MAQSRTIIRFTKFVNEYIPQGVDFVNVLDGSETIQSASVVVYEGGSNTDVTSTIIDGSASINGTIVQYNVQDGTAGAYYWIDVVATFDTSEVAIQRLRMSVPRP
jgi:hypothetical protein